MADELVEKVMVALESFYNSGADDGKDIFDKFAAEHAEHFTVDSSAIDGENKLIWTDIYKKFCALFESHVECKISFSF